MGKKRTEQEKRTDKIIKGELTKFYEYKQEITTLEERKKQCKRDYKYEMDNPPYGGSIAKMPMGSNEKDPVAMKWEKIIADIEDNLNQCEWKVHRINNWLSVLTPEQYKIIMKYVCEYQCQNRPHAALELRCSEDNIKDRVRDGIERIRKNFNNFL